MKHKTLLKRAVLLLLFLSLPRAAVAEHHTKKPADLTAAYTSFNEAYATNDVDTYFSFYAEDATVYFYGERQDLAAYHEFWKALIDSGSGVEKNDTSDVQVQLIAGGEVAIVTSFIDNRTRYPDGITEERAFETDVWQKVDSAWKIISLHYSVVPKAIE